jgi:hypothetical protein
MHIVYKKINGYEINKNNSIAIKKNNKARKERKKKRK